MSINSIIRYKNPKNTVCSILKATSSSLIFKYKKKLINLLFE